MKPVKGTGPPSTRYLGLWVDHHQLLEGWGGGEEEDEEAFQDVEEQPAEMEEEDL